MGSYPEQRGWVIPGPFLIWRAVLSRLATFVDGGYFNALAERHFHCRIDFAKFVAEIQVAIAARTPDPVDVLRTFFYDCPPYQNQNSTPAEKQRYAQKISFFNHLETLPRVQVRQGLLAYRGRDAQGAPIFTQKRVDLLLGLDLAEQSTKRQITHLALVTGDSDLCPAVEFAKREGVCVWLFHGPRNTFARDLWRCCDERFEIDQPFIDRVRRT